MGIALYVDVLHNAPADVVGVERCLLLAIAEKANDSTRRAVFRDNRILLHHAGIANADSLRRVCQRLASRGYEVRIPARYGDDGSPVFAYRGHAVDYRVPVFSERTDHPERQDESPATEDERRDESPAIEATKAGRVSAKAGRVSAKAGRESRPIPHIPHIPQGDARERAPAPEAPPSDAPQTELTSGERPATRCGRHRADSEPPPCRHCAAAREAAEAWDKQTEQQRAIRQSEENRTRLASERERAEQKRAAASPPSQCPRCGGTVRADVCLTAKCTYGKEEGVA